MAHDARAAGDDAADRRHIPTLRQLQPSFRAPLSSDDESSQEESYSDLGGDLRHSHPVRAVLQVGAAQPARLYAALGCPACGGAGALPPPHTHTSPPAAHRATPPQGRMRELQQQLLQSQQQAQRRVDGQLAAIEADLAQQLQAASLALQEKQVRGRQGGASGGLGQHAGQGDACLCSRIRVGRRSLSSCHTPVPLRLPPAGARCRPSGRRRTRRPGPGRTRRASSAWRSCSGSRRRPLRPSSSRLSAAWPRPAAPRRKLPGRRRRLGGSGRRLGSGRRGSGRWAHMIQQACMLGVRAGRGWGAGGGRGQGTVRQGRALAR